MKLVECLMLFIYTFTGSTLSVNCMDCENSKDDPASATNTDQTNNAATVTLGVILAVVIIINIVGIAVYCFIRYRKKKMKTVKADTLVNVSGNVKQSQYSYIDITHDTHRPIFSNNTESNVVENSDQRKTPDPKLIESIPKTSGSTDRPRHQSTDVGTKHKLKIAKKDDYDHVNVGVDDSSISKINIIDNYNHIDAKLTVPGDTTLNNTNQQNGLSKGKLKFLGGNIMKQKRKDSNQEIRAASYVNVKLEPDEDVDTYNHLQD